MKGYKVFNPDWTCRGFQYEVGKTYETSGVIRVCEWGFHFCEKLSTCFNYYDFNSKNKVAEVEALGVILEEDGKYCTNKIRIVRELSWYEVLDMGNNGVYNCGVGNAGDCNSGSYNKGNYNTGSHDFGSYNSNDFNSGFLNTGKYNIGNYNSGCNNIGICNTGGYNKGDYNTGCCNIGNYNTGDYNIGSYNTGCFCENSPFVNFFDSPSDWTMDNWYNSLAYYYMWRRPPLVEFRWYHTMSDDEKREHPEAKVVGGYFRERAHNEMQKVMQEWWDGLPLSGKDAIRSLPNFDAEKFERIMWGINIGEEPEPDNDGGFTIDSVSSISVKYDNGTVAKWEWDNTEA